MATISGNGGAERYWRHADGRRAVLCRNGVVLVQGAAGGRWRVRRVMTSDEPWPLVQRPPGGWEADSGQAARAAVTRTGRMARRREGAG